MKSRYAENWRRRNISRLERDYFDLRYQLQQNQMKQQLHDAEHHSEEEHNHSNDKRKGGLKLFITGVVVASIIFIGIFSVVKLARS